MKDCTPDLPSWGIQVLVLTPGVRVQVPPRAPKKFRKLLKNERFRNFFFIFTFCTFPSSNGVLINTVISGVHGLLQYEKEKGFTMKKTLFCCAFNIVFSRAHGEALAPEASAAGGGERADTVGFVFLELLTAAAEEARRIVKRMYAIAEAAVFLAVPDLVETLLIDISERMVPDTAFMLAQVGIRRVQQTHAGRDVTIPADEAVSLFDKAAPVFTAGGRFSFPGEELRVLQALLVREQQIPVPLGKLKHGDLRAEIKALKTP